jgi:hypothetical protein
MRRIAWFAAVAALATVAVLALTEGVIEIVGFELVIGALVVLAALAVGPLRPARIINRRPLVLSTTASNHPPQLQRLEWMVEFATHAGSVAERRLIPELRALAAERLQDRHGVDLSRQRDQSEALLGPQAWSYLDPERPKPAGEGGLPAKRMDMIVSAIEDL